MDTINEVRADNKLNSRTDVKVPVIYIKYVGNAIKTHANTVLTTAAHNVSPPAAKMP